LYVLGNVLVGKWEDRSIDIVERQNSLLSLVKEKKLKAFAEVVVGGSIRQGFQNLILTSGLGGMKPNTLILGWHNESSI
jgi:potassium/chloride transporter 9